MPVEKKWIQIHSTLFGSISKWKTAMITYIWYKKLWKYIAFEFVRFYALLLPACPSFHHTCCRAYRWKCHLIIEIFIDVIFTNIIQTLLNLFNSIWNSSFTDRWVIFYNFCYEKDQLLYSDFFLMICIRYQIFLSMTNRSKLYHAILRAKPSFGCRKIFRLYRATPKKRLFARINAVLTWRRVKRLNFGVQREKLYDFTRIEGKKFFMATFAKCCLKRVGASCLSQILPVYWYVSLSFRILNYY